MAIKMKNQNQSDKNIIDKKTFKDQSQLITLNALFEAARNGQAGRDLAVASEKIKAFFSYSKSK
jgi:hypothetical protein